MISSRSGYATSSCRVPGRVRRAQESISLLNQPVDRTQKGTPEKCGSSPQRAARHHENLLRRPDDITSFRSNNTSFFDIRGTAHAPGSCLKVSRDGNYPLFRFCPVLFLFQDKKIAMFFLVANRLTLHSITMTFFSHVHSIPLQRGGHCFLKLLDKTFYSQENT
jgi:hypothetical protein